MKYIKIAALAELILLCGCAGKPLDTPGTAEAAPQDTAQTLPAGNTSEPGSLYLVTEEPAESASADDGAPALQPAENGLFRLNGEWCAPEELPVKYTSFSPSKSSAHPELWTEENGERVLADNIFLSHVTEDGVMLLTRTDQAEPAGESAPRYTVYSLDPASDELSAVYSGELCPDSFSDEYFLGFEWLRDPIEGETADYSMSVVSIRTGEILPVPRFDEQVEFYILDNIHSNVIYGDEVYCMGRIEMPADLQEIYAVFRFNIPERRWSIYSTIGTVPTLRSDGVYLRMSDGWIDPRGQYQPDSPRTFGSAYYDMAAEYSEASGENEISFTDNGGKRILLGSTPFTAADLSITQSRIFSAVLFDGGNYDTIAGVCTADGKITAAELPEMKCDSLDLYWKRFTFSGRMYFINSRTLDYIELKN